MGCILQQLLAGVSVLLPTWPPSDVQAAIVPLFPVKVEGSNLIFALLQLANCFRTA